MFVKGRNPTRIHELQLQKCVIKKKWDVNLVDPAKPLLRFKYRADKYSSEKEILVICGESDIYK